MNICTSDLMSHETHSIISLTEARKSPAGCSNLCVLSVSVAGGNEAVLSCRPCSGSPQTVLLDRMVSAEIGERGRSADSW